MEELHPKNWHCIADKLPRRTFWKITQTEMVQILTNPPLLLLQFLLLLHHRHHRHHSLMEMGRVGRESKE